MTLKITDHALIRWMDRALDIETETFRARLLAIAAPYAALKVKHAEIGGLWFVFDGPTLVTVLPSKPTVNENCGNDRRYRNGTDSPRDAMNWKAKKRRRQHK